MLPQPSQLRFIVLKPGEVLTGDGEDLSIYFYRLQHEQDWIVRNAIGEPVQGNWISRYGANPASLTCCAPRSGAWAT